MISVPKNFSSTDLSDLARRIQDFAVTLENQTNGREQIYIVEDKKKLPKGLRRRDLVLKIKKTKGENPKDTLFVYWFDGKKLVPLDFSSLGGTIDVGQLPPEVVDGGGGGSEEGGRECCEILVADQSDAYLTDANITDDSQPPLPVMLTNEANDDYVYSD